MISIIFIEEKSNQSYFGETTNEEIKSFLPVNNFDIEMFEN